MSPSSLEETVRAAQTVYEKLKKTPPDTSSEAAKAARKAANNVNEALREQQFVPVALAKYFLALQQANGQFVASLRPDGQTYTDAEMAPVKEAIDQWQIAAKDYMEAAVLFRSAWKAEPLLSQTGRLVVPIVAAVLLVLGAIFAAFGSGQGLPALTTVSYWCAFAAFALGVVWICAYLSVRRSPSVATAQSGSNLQYLVFGGMAFSVLAFLVAGVLTGELLKFLSSISGARGLITFLVAIGTIAIAVILTLASVIMEASDEGVLKERLSKGKEILTVLVGVLGTIVGFYFASNPEGADPGKITVGIIETQKSVEAGGDFNIQAMTTGGELPYDSTPIITVVKGVEGEGSVNEQGLIKVKFKVGAEMKPGPIPFVVGLRDKSGKTATVKSEINVVPKKEH